MSRCVKNLRHRASAANKGPDAVNATPKGTQKAYGSVTRNTGKEHLGDGSYEGQSTPAFDRAGKVLTKFTGPSI